MRERFAIIGYYLSLFVFVLTILFAYYGYKLADPEQKKAILGLLLFSSIFLFINWLSYKKYKQKIRKRK